MLYRLTEQRWQVPILGVSVAANVTESGGGEEDISRTTVTASVDTPNQSVGTYRLESCARKEQKTKEGQSSDAKAFQKLFGTAEGEENCEREVKVEEESSTSENVRENCRRAGEAKDDCRSDKKVEDCWNARKVAKTRERYGINEEFQVMSFIEHYFSSFIYDTRSNMTVFGE